MQCVPLFLAPVPNEATYEARWGQPKYRCILIGTTFLTSQTTYGREPVSNRLSGSEPIARSNTRMPNKSSISCLLVFCQRLFHRQLVSLKTSFVSLNTMSTERLSEWERVPSLRSHSTYEHNFFFCALLIESVVYLATQQQKALVGTSWLAFKSTYAHWNNPLWNSARLFPMNNH